MVVKNNNKTHTCASGYISGFLSKAIAWFVIVDIYNRSSEIWVTIRRVNSNITTNGSSCAAAVFQCFVFLLVLIQNNCNVYNKANIKKTSKDAPDYGKEFLIMWMRPSNAALIIFPNLRLRNLTTGQATQYPQILKPLAQLLQFEGVFCNGNI